MRLFGQIALSLILVVTAAGQSVRVDEKASKAVLRGTTYGVELVADSAQAIAPANLQLEIIAPNGSRVASSSSDIQLKSGANKLTASVPLPQLPKRADDLIWYRLVYRISSNGSELAHGVLPLFESVQDFALHVSAPALRSAAFVDRGPFCS